MLVLGGGRSRAGSKRWKSRAGSVVLESRAGVELVLKGGRVVLVQGSRWREESCWF